MAKKLNNGIPKRKRSSRPLTQLDGPGLFDYLEPDIIRDLNDINDSQATVQPKHVSQTAQKQELDIDSSLLTRKSSLRFISFGSGSSGNCSYLGFDTGEGRQTGVLIDAGVEPDTVYEALRDNRIDLRSISGILLTHDHGDHVKYAYNLVRKTNWVVYTTMRTLQGILRRHNISRRIKDSICNIYIENEFNAGGFRVTPFATSHDGTENVGYAINTPDGAHRFVLLTDTGIITERADHYMRQANYIVIESNYDSTMLTNGEYPEYLKARIRGDRGHLDNVEAANYIKDIYSPRLSHVFLCHLSEENNTPEIARRTMHDALTRRGLRIGDPTNPLMSADTDIALAVLPRREVTTQFILRHK